MISFNELNVQFNDPEELKLLGVFRRMEVQNEFEFNRFDFKVPDNIKENKDKKEYRAGFLNEMTTIFNPLHLKKQIFEYVTVQFHIFVDQRQYENMVKEYTKKKYSIFIKK